jgi:hypothetical protein
MKLITLKKYFDRIKAGEKKIDYRDAHITFVCEETGEKLVKNVKTVSIVNKADLPGELKESSIFDDERVIAFELEE